MNSYRNRIMTTGIRAQPSMEHIVSPHIPYVHFTRIHENYKKKIAFILQLLLKFKLSDCRGLPALDGVAAGTRKMFTETSIFT